MTGDWREGHRLLAERVARAPEAVRAALSADPPPLDFEPRALRGFRVTGIGSSAAHARFLAHLLAAELSLPARFVPAGAFLDDPPAEAGDEVLAVFSQGLSPNARFALRAPHRWRRLVLFTAADAAGAPDEKRERIAALREAGALVVAMPGAEEYGTLVRVLGPLAGYAVALRFAQGVARRAELPAPGLDADPGLVFERMRAAPDAFATAADALPAAALAAPLAFLASGAYGELVENLRLKLLEGLLRPLPPVWDPLHFAHGPFQQAFPGEATFAALGCAGAPREEELLARVASMLEPARHHLLRLPSALPAPLAIFEHEALLNQLLLRRIAEEGIDPTRWPGRDREQRLYALAPAAAAVPPGSADAAQADGSSSRGGSALARLTWPELAARLEGGAATAVVPLGATEQHGPHLPFATDTWIAGALAERFCARVEGAVRLPALPLGCSSEHLGFPGTLHLRPDTLRAVLGDVLASLRAHGFACAFVFSAHGGNAAVLEEALPALRVACAPLALCAFTDLGALTRALHRAGAALGVDPAAAGHHAGELETSILAALRPRQVRRDRLAPGVLCGRADAQELFYPSLRERAPSGTVGDPRGASAARAEAYLEAWTELLVSDFRRQRSQTKGTQNA